MAKKLSDEEKKLFISQNESFIPEKSRNGFFADDVDKQYTKIQTYIRKAKEKETLLGQVKSKLSGKSVDPDEVKKIIEVCEKWIEKNKNKIISKLEEDIKKLEEEKQKYTKL